MTDSKSEPKLGEGVWIKATSHRSFYKVRRCLGSSPQTYYNLDSRKSAGTYRFVVTFPEFKKIESIRGVSRCRPKDVEKWQPTVNFGGREGLKRSRYSDAQLLHWHQYDPKGRRGSLKDGTAVVTVIGVDGRRFLRPLEKC